MFKNNKEKIKQRFAATPCCGKANRDFSTKIEFFREENVPATKIEQ